MRIMIAVDASRHSDEAVKFVTRMRWPPGSRMIVVSVLPPVGSMSALAAMPAETSADSALRSAAAIEAAATIERAENTLRAAGVSVQGYVLEGEPREAILGAARDERVDLIAVGSHGRTGLARLLLGSVSSHVTTHAPCSVLVVKVSDDPARGAARADYSFRTIHRDPTVP